MQTKLINYLVIIPALLVSAIGCSSLQNGLGAGQKSKGIFGFGANSRDTERNQIGDDSLDPMGARSINRLLADDLTPGQFVTTWKSRMVSGSNPEEASRLMKLGNQQYAAAVALKQEGGPDGQGHISAFEEAANTFRMAASNWTESQVEEDALFHEGESYFNCDRYVQSNRAFEKLVSLYSGSRYLDTAEKRRMQIANYWLELARVDQAIRLNDPKRPKSNLAGEARRILYRIRLDDPTGKLADDATFALGTAHFEAEQYFEAANTYEDLRRNYPGSPHQFHAHLFELKSRLKSYRGPDYDDEPLVKADELLKAIVRRFPQQARDQEEFLSKEAGNIQNMLAGRDVSMAEYFAKRGENEAAKLYYQKIAKNYPNGNLQTAVQEEIARLAELPPVPEQRAQWLVDMFGKPDVQKPVIASRDNGTTIR